MAMSSRSLASMQQGAAPPPPPRRLRCWQSAGTPRSTALARAAPQSGLPQDWTQVAGWARDKFKEAVQHRADEQVPLAQACMLIALEEEAAVEVHPELRELLMAQTDLRVRTTASSSTWTLSRLDALAQQVRDHLDRQGGAQVAELPRRDQQQPQEQAQQQEPGQRQQAHVQDPQQQQQQQQQPAHTAAARRPHPLRAVLAAINTVLFTFHGYKASNRYGEPRDSHLSSVLERGLGCSTALSVLYMQVAERLGVRLAAIQLEEGRYVLLTPATPCGGEAAADHDQPPGQLLLIDAYGGGELLDADEVCELFGVTRDDLGPRGWSTRKQLLAGLLGQLRDAYFHRAVGCSPSPALAVPLTLETALDPGRVAGGTHLHAMDRALAAAEKITWCTPHDRRAQLHFALLLYHSRRWDDAWIELGLFLERHHASHAPGGGPEGAPGGREEVEAREVEQARMVLEKVRLQLGVPAVAAGDA